MRTALVVDDSTGARRRVATLLKLGGWRVNEAAGPAAALRLARVARPGLVVTDAVLRGGSGIALLYRLRAEGCRARSIVITARPTELVRAQAVAAGALTCLPKPVDPQVFLELMRGLASPARPQQPAATFEAALRVDAERLDRTQQAYTAALRRQLSTGTSGPRNDALRNVLSHDRLRQVLALSVAHRARAALEGQAATRR